MLSLTGLPLLVALSALSVAMYIALIIYWNRFRGWSSVRNVQRIAFLLLAQLLVVATAMVGINRSMVFYATWSDLIGSSDSYQNPVIQNQSKNGGFLDSYIRSAQASAKFKTEGAQFSFVLKGAKSGVTAPVYVYLPPTYGAEPLKKWPVLVLLPGYPGVPTTWFHALDLVHILRHEVSTGNAQDFVIVLPTMSVAPPRDTECTDIPGGPKVNTWLGVDVPEAAIAGLSVSTNRLQWAIAGYSTGGFCAAKVALSHPDRFAISIPIAAYFEPETGSMTGDLFGGSKEIKRANSPLLLAKALKLHSRMLLVGTSQDPGVMGEIAKMEKIHNPNLLIDKLVDPNGGHSTKVWKNQLPRILGWLTQAVQ